MKPNPQAASTKRHMIPPLFAEHLIVQSLCVDLIARVDAGDWHLVDAIWDEFAARLRQHMVLEETEWFPRFVRRHPDSRAAIECLQNEHQGFRADLDRLGVALQLHQFNCDEARAMVDRIRRHGDAENIEFYPWLGPTFLPADPEDTLPTPAVPPRGPSTL